jgi:hypothetical protein
MKSVKENKHACNCILPFASHALDRFTGLIYMANLIALLRMARRVDQFSDKKGT